MKKLLTIDDLLNFCEKNNFSEFNIKNKDAELRIQLPAKAIFKQSDSDKHTEGLRPFIATAYHDHVNLNKSNINEDTFQENSKSLPYRPILANIIEDSDGNKDFGSHDFTITIDSDGNEVIEYQESPVGVISTDYIIEYDSESKVNRAIVNGYLWEGYCQDAIDILERRQSVNCSVELNIREFSFNAKEKVLNLDDYYVEGLTLLNQNIGAGMAGSNMQLSDFESNTKSLYSNFNINVKLIETLDMLNNTISNFNINNAKRKEDMTVKLKELLKKYNKSVEDLNFDYESLSDDALESAFKEAFDDDSNINEVVENDTQEDIEEKNNFDVSEVNDEEIEDIKDESVFSKTFELSHGDIRVALYELLEQYEKTDDSCYYIEEVYDSYFVYSNFADSKIFGQNYTKDEESVSFDGERFELHRELLTDSEYAELQSMRENYSLILNKVKEYEKTEETAKINSLFNIDDYNGIKESDEFNTLLKNHDELTFNEVKNKLDSILLTYAKSGKLSFSKDVNSDINNTKKYGLANSKVVNKKNKFGSLFAK